MAVLIGENDVTGGAAADFIIGLGTGIGTNRLRGGGGNDVVLADRPPTFVDVATNTSIATAMALGTGTGFSTGADVLVSTGTVPHASVVAQGAGNSDYYAVYLAAGQTLTLDVDFAAGGYGGGSFDAVTQVLSGSGAVLASNDDGPTEAGDTGSVSPLDPFLVYTAAASGTVYVRVSGFSGSVPVGSAYLLNLSVTNANATGYAVTYGQEVFGEDGNDYLVGGSGTDELFGGTGDDRVLGGSGSDALNGGGGNDLLDGGFGEDTADYWLESTGGVTVSLALQGTAQNTGSAGADVLTGIESLRGTDFADTLTGDAGANTIHGEAGADTINGGAGVDYIYAGSGFGIDKLDGGTDFDRLYLDDYLDIDVDAGTARDSGGVLLKQFTNFEHLINEGGGTYRLGVNSVTLWLSDTFDYVTLGTGRARVDAEGGTDTVDVSAITGVARYQVNLTTGRTSFTDSGGDYLIDFENLTSSSSIALDVLGTKAGNRIVGGTGDDVINGANGDDMLKATAGNDRLLGGLGDDQLVSGLGNDRMEGGAGVDVGYYSLADNGVTVSLAATASQNTGMGQDSLYGIEGLFGSIHDDVLTGDGLANMLNGSDGDDTLMGAAGDDALSAGYGVDHADGGDGADVLILNNENWQIDLDARSGYSLGGSTIAFDAIETVRTGSGGDVVELGADDWTLDLGGGNDRAVIATGASSVQGGDGIDTIDLSTLDGLYYVIDLASGTTNYSGLGEHFFGFENVTGGSGNESVTGASGANVILLGAGDDLLAGGSGADTLGGGAGRDTLTGGAGKDRLTGGAGIDVFRFFDGDFGTAAKQADLVTDFTQGADRIDLQFSDGNTSATGVQHYTFVGTAAFTGAAAQLRYEIADGQTIVSADRNGDAVGDWFIRLSGEIALGTGDFILIPPAALRDWGLPSPPLLHGLDAAGILALA